MKTFDKYISNYIKDLLTPCVSGHSLRSVDAALLVVPRSQFVKNGGWTFAVHAPRLWNTVPVEIRLMDLKHHLNHFLKLSLIGKCLHI